MLDFLRLKGPLDTDDSVERTKIHHDIIRQKPFLKALYRDIYRSFSSLIDNNSQNMKIVEIGSGSGFIKEIIPSAITSDVMNLPYLDMQLSIMEMPFEDNSIDAFLMYNVFHHLSDAHAALTEMTRCLKQNGQIILIEPSNTLWGKFVSKYLHYEPYDENGDWEFKGDDPLKNANTALPYIVFIRDRDRFVREFPRLTIENIKFHNCFIYLISGGLSYRQFMPSFTYPFFRFIEQLLAYSGLSNYLGTLQTVVLRKH